MNRKMRPSAHHFQVWKSNSSAPLPEQFAKRKNRLLTNNPFCRAQEKLSYGGYSMVVEIFGGHIEYGANFETMYATNSSEKITDDTADKATFQPAKI